MNTIFASTILCLIGPFYKVQPYEDDKTSRFLLIFTIFEMFRFDLILCKIEKQKSQVHRIEITSLFTFFCLSMRLMFIYLISTLEAYV